MLTNFVYDSSMQAVIHRQVLMLGRGRGRGRGRDDNVYFVYCRRTGAFLSALLQSVIQCLARPLTQLTSSLEILRSIL